jgi:hypothetical protein
MQGETPKKQTQIHRSTTMTRNAATAPALTATYVTTAAAWPFPHYDNDPALAQDDGGFDATSIIVDPADATPVPAPVRRRTRKVAGAVPSPPALPVAAEKPLPPTTHVATPWPEVKHDTDTPYGYSVGIELTMMPQILSGKGSSTDSRIAQNYANIMEKFLDAQSANSVYKMHSRDPHQDQYCVECPSKPLKKWGEIKKFYDNYAKLMLDIGLLPHSPKLSSGGGHIHIGGLKTSHIVNIMRDVQNKPWLMWTFNEPDDSTSANSFTEDLAEVGDKLKNAAKTLNADPTLFASEITTVGSVALLFYGNPEFASTDWLPDDKGKALRYVSTYRTLEFRFFEAPANWEEQEAQLRFVHAYVGYIDKQYKGKQVELVITTNGELTALKRQECEIAFRALLDTLDLPHAPYERMIKENLGYRFKRGKKV